MGSKPKHLPYLKSYHQLSDQKLREMVLSDLVGVAIGAINKNKNMFVNNIFEDIVYHFKDLIFDGRLGPNTPLGRIDKFVHDFEVQLKKEIYLHKPELSRSVELSVREFVAELEKNTSAFYEKYIQLEKNREKLFKHTLKFKRFDREGNVNINALAKIYTQLVPKTIGNTLTDMLYAQKSIGDFIEFAEKNKALFLEDPKRSSMRYAEKSAQQKQKLKHTFEQLLKAETNHKIDSILRTINQIQRFQKIKLSRYQDKRDAKVEHFTEGFIEYCKKHNIKEYDKVVKKLVRTLEEKGLFSHNGIQSSAATILKSFRRDSYFLGFSNIDRQTFIKSIKNRALSNEIVDNDRYGKQWREMSGFALKFKKLKYDKKEFYETPEILKQALLKRVEKQELTNKSSMGTYIPELIDKLLELKKLKLPDFDTVEARTAFIEHYKKDVLNSVCIRIDEFKIEIIEATLDRITDVNENAHFQHSSDKLVMLLEELKDQKLFKGKLHHRFITHAIIDRIWGQTQETTPFEFRRTQKLYRQKLIDLYSKDVSSAQTKISVYNKIGLLASTGSLGLGLWAIAALAGVATMPALGPVAIVAPFAIATSFTGLANSRYASVFTRKKDFAQNIVDELISGEEKEDYRELFSHSPTVNKLAIYLFRDKQLKAKNQNPYNLFYEFMLKLDSLDKHEAKDLVKELEAEDLDINTIRGKKAFMVRLLKKAQAAIEANTDYVEHKSEKYATRSFIASLGTFTAGSTVTAASVVAGPITALTRVLDIFSTFITATGMASIYNANRLDQTKRHKTSPYNNLYTNLGVIVNHINSDKARIQLPEHVCAGYRMAREERSKHAQPVKQHEAKPEIDQKTEKKKNHASRFVDGLSAKKKGSFVDFIKEKKQLESGNDVALA